MATIRDVAKAAQVSITTVSRVLNRDKKFHISPGTRQKVLESARSLGYAPEKTAGEPENAALHRLRVGCILNSVRPKYADSFYMSLLSSFEAELGRLGGTLLFLKTPGELLTRREEALRLYREAGCVVIMEYLPDQLYADLRANVPYLLGVDIEDPGIDTVTHDRLEASMMAMEYLIQKGHRAIAYIGGNEHRPEDMPGGQDSLSGNRRYWGYRCSLICHRLSFRPEWVSNCHWDVDTCRRQIHALMSREDRPTAILAASDTVAIAAISACGEMGFRVPEDISIIGISDNEQSRYSNPPLTTVRIPQDILGVLAARQIMAPRMEYPRKIHVPLSLVERGSVAAVPPAEPDPFCAPRAFPAISW